MDGPAILVDGDKAYTTTRIIAKCCQVEHKAAIYLVEKYKKDFNDIGPCKLSYRKFQTPGRPGTEAVLSEQQATFLMTLMRNSKAVMFYKKKIIQKFFETRLTLAEMAIKVVNHDLL